MRGADSLGIPDPDDESEAMLTGMDSLARAGRKEQAEVGQLDPKVAETNLAKELTERMRMEAHGTSGGRMGILHLDASLTLGVIGRAVEMYDPKHRVDIRLIPEHGSFMMIFRL